MAAGRFCRQTPAAAWWGKLPPEKVPTDSPIRVPPPSLIPKGGTRLGRLDRKARRKPPWHRRCHQETPGEGFLRKTVHRTIFLFSCACWRYKTLGALPLLGCRLGQALDGAHRAPAPLPAFFRRKLGKELYPPTARTCASGSHRRGVQPPSLGANCPARPRAANCLGCNPRELRAQALGPQGRR